MSRPRHDDLFEPLTLLFQTPEQSVSSPPLYVCRRECVCPWVFPRSTVFRRGVYTCSTVFARLASSGRRDLFTIIVRRPGVRCWVRFGFIERERKVKVQRVQGRVGKFGNFAVRARTRAANPCRRLRRRVRFDDCSPSPFRTLGASHHRDCRVSL